MKPLCVLLVEDSEDDATLTLRELRRSGYEVSHRRVDNAEAMRAALGERSWEVVLSDHNMPTFNSLQALAVLRELSPETPMIIVSGTIGEEIAVEAIRAGARYYLLKHDLRRLGPAVQRELDAARERSQKRAAEQALQAASDEVRKLQERALRFFTLSLEMLCIVDFEGHFRELNPAWERVLGYTLAELRDTAFIDLVHPADRDATLSEWRSIVAGGSTVTFQNRYRTKSGAYRWLQWSSAVSRAESLCYAAARDVTESLLAKEELHARAERQQAVAELGQLALARPEPTKLMNEAAAVVARTLDARYVQVHKLVPGGDSLSLLAATGDARGPSTIPSTSECHQGFTLRADGPVVAEDFRTETRFRPPASSSADIASGICVNLPGDAAPVGVLGAFATSPRSFTPGDSLFLQSVANVLATAIRHQDHQEALRSMESQFRQAQKMEAVGRLAGGVAHDFNNLLTAIMGYSELMLVRLRANDPLRRDVEEIRKAGTRATSLTRQLLVFSRHQALERKVLDVNAIVADMEKMLGRLLGEDIAMGIVLDQNLGRIQADGGQIEQVILNLTVNARDAMPRGGRITIETANAELDEHTTGLRGAVKPGPYVMLAVSDTGTGIPKDVLVHIFEPFFTTKEAGKGTGLGLSTVYGIVQGSSGVVSVYTEVGAGTSFKVYFPRVAGELDAPAPVVSAPLGKGTETILLVEDDELVRELAHRVLELQGYDVIVAPNGGAALLACEKHRGAIDMMLTDVVMPEMSGRELVDRMRKLLPDLKVLYFSGYTSGVVLHDDVVGSGAAFLQKPFAPQTLLRKVREVLSEPRP